MATIDNEGLDHIFMLSLAGWVAYSLPRVFAPRGADKMVALMPRRADCRWEAENPL